MNVHRRLLALERKTKHGDGTLILPDGGTLVIQVSDWLGLTLAAMRREHARTCGAPAPSSRFDRTLDMLERATGVGPESPPLLDVAHSVLHNDFEPMTTTIN